MRSSSVSKRPRRSAKKLFAKKTEHPERSLDFRGGACWPTFGCVLMTFRPCLLVFGVALIVLTPVRCECARRKTPTPEPPPQLASLQASQVSAVVTSGRGGAGMRYLSVLVTNRGAGCARDIQVYLEDPDGLRLIFRGPRKLPGGQRAVFVSTTRFPAGIGVRGRIVTSCSTCRR